MDDNGKRELEIRCAVTEVQSKVIVTLAVNGLSIDIIDDISDQVGELVAKSTIIPEATEDSHIECIVTIPDSHYIWRQSRRYKPRKTENIPYLALVSGESDLKVNLLYLFLLMIATFYKAS